MMNRHEFLSTVRAGQQAFLEALKRVPPSEAEKPILAGERSVKDLAAHATYWQALVNRQVQAVLRGQPPEPGPRSHQDVDDRNRQAVEDARERAYDELVHEFELASINLSNTLELLSQEDLFEQGRFQEISGEPLWKNIAVNSYEHLEEHIHELALWK